MRTTLLAILPILLLGACGGDDNAGPTAFELAACIRGDITVGETVNGTLAASDCDLDTLGGFGYFESYRLTVAANTTVDVAMSSNVFDTFIFLFSVPVENVDSLELVTFDDDNGGGPNGTNSLISGVPLTAGNYLVMASGYDYPDVGAYSLSVSVSP